MLKSSLHRWSGRSPSSAQEIEKLRAAAWHQHGVISIKIGDITDCWLKQALVNMATKLYGPRKEPS